MGRPDKKTENIFFLSDFFVVEVHQWKFEGYIYDFRSQSIRGMKVISIPSNVFVSDTSRVST